MKTGIKNNKSMRVSFSGIGRKLVTGSFLRITELIVSVLAGLLLMPFIIHSIGDRMYGLWILIASFIGFYGIFDFGLSSAVQRHVSQAIGTNDYKSSNKIINTSLLLFFLISGVVILVTLVTIALIPLFSKDPTEVRILRIVFAIVGSSLAFSFPPRVFLGVLTAHLRHDLGAITEIVKIIIRSLLVFILLQMGYGIIMLAVATLTAEFCSTALKLIFSRIVAPYMTLSLRFIDKTKFRPLFNYSSFSFIATIGDKLRFNIDNFIIAAYLGAEFITVYVIAVRLLLYFMDLIASATGVIRPLFSQYESRGDYESIRKLYIISTKISICLSVLIGGGLIIHGKTFIGAWMGQNYISAYSFMLILIIPGIIATMVNPSLSVLLGVSKHKFFAISNLIEGISNVGLSLILVRYYGLFGIAMGTAIPMFVIKLFIEPAYTCKIIDLNIKFYYTRVLLPMTIKSVTVMAVFWLGCRNYIRAEYPLLLLFTILNVLFFCSVIYFIGFSQKDKTLFRNSILRRK